MPGRKEHILTLQLFIRTLELHHIDCERLVQRVLVGREPMILYPCPIKDSRLETILTLPSPHHVQWVPQDLDVAERFSVEFV